ncbi:MAG: braC [Candidatus Taylorbacteria bacterium]|nr:braC [Candidatus Taylorbacteria bacterium]
MEPTVQSSKSKKNLIVGIVIIVAIVLVIAASAGNSKKDTIKIGGAYILSGPQALIGDLQKNASQIALDEINANGGINGQKVELVLEDSAYDPKKSVDAYNALKLRGVKYILADGSPVVGAIRETAVKDGNLIFAVGATTPGYFDGSPLSCRIALTAKSFGPGYTELLGKKAYKSVVMLLPDNEYGKGIAAEFTKAFEPTGGKIAAIEFYNATGNGDFRTNITKLKAQQANADAMILVNVANTVEPMLKQVKELGWKKPLVSDYYLAQNPALKDLSLAEGMDFVDYDYSRDALATDSDVTKAFKKTYETKFGSKPVYLAAGYYDSLKIVAEAISKVGNDPKKVGDYISSLKGYQGITGSLTFNSDCEVNRALVFRTVKGGTYVDLVK